MSDDCKDCKHYQDYLFFKEFGIDPTKDDFPKRLICPCCCRHNDLRDYFEKSEKGE